jgi:zinc protease
VATVDSALRANTDVATEVLTTRLTNVIREQLGESYSPRAVAFISNDPGAFVQTFVQVTGAPDRIVSVGELVVAELADLAANGPNEREFQGAYAHVEETYSFVDNGTFLEEIINEAIFPDRELEDYLGEGSALADVTADTVRQFVADHVPASQYVQVAVLPR